MAIVKTHRFRDFSSGFTESGFQRILNTFYLLKAKELSIRFWYTDILYDALIIQIGKGEVVIAVPGFEPGQNYHAEIYFELLNQYHYCKVNIIKIKSDRLTIELPKEFLCLKDRKFPRIRFDDLFIRFNILYSSLFTSKGEEIELLNRYFYLFEEVSKDSPSTKLLYRMLLSKMKGIGSNFSIAILRRKDSEALTLHEKILLKTKKTLLVEDVSKMESYIEPLSSPLLTNLSTYYKEREAAVGEFKAIREIEAVSKEDSQNFLISYLMSPIDIYDQIIGYIRIETDQFQKYWVRRYEAEEFHTICKIFSYGLAKIRIRDSHFDVNSVRTRVLNISISGLLMEIFDKVLFEYLKIFSKVKLLLPIAGRELEIYGEIKRFFSKGGGYYMGVEFFESLPGDTKYLEEYIYENLRYNFF